MPICVRRAFAALALSVLACTVAAPSFAAAPSPPAAPARVADFTLKDQTQVAHRLYGLADAKAVVLVTQMNGCPIVRNIVPALNDLKAAYGPKGVTFLMLNSSRQDTREDIAAEVAEYDIRLPVLIDASQAVGKRLGVVRTAELIVIDPKTWSVVYHGPLDDRLSYGTQKAKAEHPYGVEAIEAALAGRTVTVAHRDTQGCLINFE